MQKMRLGEAVRWLAIFTLFGVALACAGANGDPAPATQEAGASGPPECTDAGATE